MDIRRYPVSLARGGIQIVAAFSQYAVHDVAYDADIDIVEVGLPLARDRKHVLAGLRSGLVGHFLALGHALQSRG